MAVKRFLELLGFPTKNEQGHEIGCVCQACMLAWKLTQNRPFRPGTVGWILQEAARKRRERETKQ